MTLYLNADDIRAVADPEVTLKAAETACQAEAAGLTSVPPRMDAPSRRGFLRVMPAVLDGAMGLKVMTLVEGVGTRYLVLLYDVETGALLAVLDADEITRLRTAACTALAGRIMVDGAPTVLGLVGSGFEAGGHLRILAALWPLGEAVVYSPSPERRTAFAAGMSAELGITVRAVDTTAEAVAASDTVVLATKATEPVVDGTAFRPGSVVLSIGSTRPDLRELDLATLARTGSLVVDDAVQVAGESGDVIDGLGTGALTEDRLVPIATALTEPGSLVREPGRDLLAFKSVGTASHDLALAGAVLEAARAAGRGRDLGELSSLKPFAAARTVAATAERSPD